MRLLKKCLEKRMKRINKLKESIEKFGFGEVKINFERKDNRKISG